MNDTCSTPIVDFLSKYAGSKTSRLHMPGHKGVAPASIPADIKAVYGYDITEITGADNLYAPMDIIKESEDNASAIFGAKTFYSTEGSSLAIKSMLYLALKHYELNEGPVKEIEKPYIITIGMCHKALFHAVELLNLRIKRVASYKDDPETMYKELNLFISEERNKPIGVYVTYPDYFGDFIDLRALKGLLTLENIPLLVDGAHCAYYKFLNREKYGRFLHPIDCFADVVCSSAHKTLPCLTGSSYLHISESFKDVLMLVKHAMDLFGSSSPSYLIMASLDAFNAVANDFEKDLNVFCNKVYELKRDLINKGFNVKKTDPLRIVVLKDEKYTGNDFAKALRAKECEPECFDKEYVIMMLSPYNKDEDLVKIKDAFASLEKSDADLGGEVTQEYDINKNFS